MNTGENEQGLRKILDMSRLLSVTILGVHFYHAFYSCFDQWRLTSKFSRQLLDGLLKTGLFDTFYNAKVISLGFLIISLLGAKGKKSETLDYKTGVTFILAGSFLFWGSYFALFIGLSLPHLSVVYMSVTGIGFTLILT